MAQAAWNENNLKGRVAFQEQYIHNLEQDRDRLVAQLQHAAHECRSLRHALDDERREAERRRRENLRHRQLQGAKS